MFLGRDAQPAFKFSRFLEWTRFFAACWTFSENNSVLWEIFQWGGKEWQLLVQKILRNMKFLRRYNDSLLSKIYHTIHWCNFFVFSSFFSDWFVETAFYASRGKHEISKFLGEKRNFNFYSRFGQEESFRIWQNLFPSLIKTAFNFSNGLSKLSYSHPEKKNYDDR